MQLPDVDDGKDGKAKRVRDQSLHAAEDEALRHMIQQRQRNQQSALRNQQDLERQQQAVALVNEATQHTRETRLCERRLAELNAQISQQERQLDMQMARPMAVQKELAAVQAKLLTAEGLLELKEQQLFQTGCQLLEHDKQHQREVRERQQFKSQLQQDCDKLLLQKELAAAANNAQADAAAVANNAQVQAVETQLEQAQAQLDAAVARCTTVAGDCTRMLEAAEEQANITLQQKWWRLMRAKATAHELEQR